MELYINDEKVDVTLEDEKTVGDVLKGFEAECEENNAAVIGIAVDAEKVTAESFDDVAKNELKPNTKIEFSVITKQAIFDSFKRLSTLFSELAARMEELPTDLQLGREKEITTTIKNLADNIEEFCHIAALATLFDDFSDILIENVPFKDFFAEFSPILKDFEDALKANDTVSVSDLAEYEICPRLQAISKTLENLQ